MRPGWQDPFQETLPRIATNDSGTDLGYGLKGKTLTLILFRDFIMDLRDIDDISAMSADTKQR